MLIGHPTSFVDFLRLAIGFIYIQANSLDLIVGFYHVLQTTVHILVNRSLKSYQILFQ